MADKNDHTEEYSTTDFLDKQLSIGDFVVFREPFETGLLVGKIVGFKDSRVVVRYYIIKSNTVGNQDNRRAVERLSYPVDMIKMSDEDSIIWRLKNNV